MARIGLLGGAFNPPHAGHLKLAELAWNALELDAIRFIPSCATPLKPVPDAMPAPDQRIHLLEAAVRDLPFPTSIETLELERGGVSYTADTLERLVTRDPGHAWIFVMGSDQLAMLLEWRHFPRILELASLAIALRPGAQADLPPVLAPRVAPRWSGTPGELVWLPSTDLDLASRRLRACLAADRPAPGLSPNVMAAIRSENLYR